MNRNNDQTSPLSLEPQIDEDRVRRALGLKTSGTHQQRPEQARARHRFATDGSVPVVMLNRTDSDTTALREKVANLEALLEGERSAHSGTRRTLAELQTSFQALQTRHGHTELAHAEALNLERAHRRTAEEALAARRMADESAPPVERPVAVATRRAKPDEERKPRAAAAKEPKPVRWWTPSYRSKNG